MKLFLLSSAFLLLHALPAAAQTKTINEQSQSWFSINSTIKLYKKWGMVADAHVRRDHFIAQPNFYFARVGGSYWLKDNLTLTAGYAQLWLKPARVNWHHFAVERRVYQQVQMTGKLGRVALLNRLRNEQRWHENIVNDRSAGTYRFSNRVRYLLSITVPVFKNPHYPSLVVADELAIQFGKEIVYNTFDQNRTFVGIRQQLTRELSFDMGYMMLYQQKASGYQYDKNHTFRWFFYYTPDFRKKKAPLALAHAEV